jgi:hypothetical protein
MNTETGPIPEPGDRVRDAHGRSVGKVVSCEGDRFRVRRGLIFPDYYNIPYPAVAEVRPGEVYLRDQMPEAEEPPESWVGGETPPGDTLVRILGGIEDGKDRAA